MGWEVIAEQRCFGGVQAFYRHDSATIGLPMRFALYRPPQAAERAVPVLYFLAGLTCSEETASIKAGAQRLASELGLALVMPDTSPRSTGIEGATGDWEFGEAASFYLDATQAPWSRHFRMETYLTLELPALLAQQFGSELDLSRTGICGHSMGGHGALTLALRHPSLYRSVSAFAPIVAPMSVPWGRKALPRFLGADQAAWRRHDTCALIEDGARFSSAPLIDQGEADKFLVEQLRPELLESACAKVGQALMVRRQAGYDHSYWFVQSFIADHLRYHDRALGGG
jgi:S-formylglutathione hydrolase